MYKKCENCYKDGKTPNEESCRKCEDDLKAKEQECEELRLGLIEAKAQGDYLNNLALSKTLDTVSGELDQLKAENESHNNRLEKLHKTLIEIKEMCNSVENIENVKTLYDAALSGMYLQANKILQKVREVIPDEN